MDDVSLGAYAGGDPGSMWQNDVVELMVDGDHSGGWFDGFSVADYGDEMTKLLTGYQAQRYFLVPESPDGVHIRSSAAASGWITDLPWADAGGSSLGLAPTTSVAEGHVTPWDALDWHGPEVSTRSTLEEGRVIGFQIATPDWDVVGTLHGFYTVSGQANTWRTADSFVDGELIGCDGEGCGRSFITTDSLPSWSEYCGHSAVRSESWGRIKAALR